MLARGQEPAQVALAVPQQLVDPVLEQAAELEVPQELGPGLLGPVQPRRWVRSKPSRYQQRPCLLR